MDDLISRQEAIELVKDVCDAIMSGCESRYDPETEDEVYTDIREVDAILKCNKEVRIALRNMPSAQPEKRTDKCTKTHSCDCISRQDAIRIVDGIDTWQAGWRGDAIESMKALPSAQPDLSEYSDKLWEKAYERGKAEAQQRWIPFKTRPLTEEEKEEHPEWDRILDCKLPDDGQAILVSIDLRGHECVQYDEFYSDDGSYLDSGYEIGDEAVAWMPLPEPYREEGD